jgi:hypothetical protein
MELADLNWDWRPKYFRPPFTLWCDKEYDETRFVVIAVGSAPHRAEWHVASIRDATREQAENLLDLVRIRYETEEFK